MNRLVLVSEDNISTTSVAGHGQHHKQQSTRQRRAGLGFDLPYSTFAPIHYEPGYAYPLVVWLHDSDSNERELSTVMPLVSMRNYVAIAPRGTCEQKRTHGRYGWRQSTDAIESAQSRIVECIAVAKERFNIHERRVFLVGRGTGGTMALRTAWREPSKYAGVVAINGPLPTRMSPMRRVNELRHVPCLLTTSRDSQSYPADQVCQDLRLLHVAGCTVALRQYPGGDDLTSNMLSDLDRWLMELVCGAKS
jgi:phospholipase/carboxylesterase